METISHFVSASRVDEKLIRAVIRQVGGWDVMREIAHGVTIQGADAGWPGFAHYVDTVAFTKRHKKLILAELDALAENTGTDLITLISGFRCLKGETPGSVAAAIYAPRAEETVVYNALAWYALEEVAQSLDENT